MSIAGEGTLREARIQHIRVRLLGCPESGNATSHTAVGLKKTVQRDAASKIARVGATPMKRVVGFRTSGRTLARSECEE